MFPIRRSRLRFFFAWYGFEVGLSVAICFLRPCSGGNTNGDRSTLGSLRQASH